MTTTCKQCGGTNVRRACWVDCNTGRLEEDVFGDERDCWCCDCGDDVELVEGSSPPQSCEVADAFQMSWLTWVRVDGHRRHTIALFEASGGRCRCVDSLGVVIVSAYFASREAAAMWCASRVLALLAETEAEAA